MPNWETEGADSCDCQMGHACDYHQEQQDRRREEERAAMESKGLDPDASVEGLEELVLAVGCSSALSQNQKDAIMRVLFQRGR